MASGKGFGKTILFGEHFVVYGLPGIASGIGKYAQVDAEKIDGEDIIFEDKMWNETVSYIESPDHVKHKQFEKLFNEMQVKGVKLIISGDITPGAGMGYSAAWSVALIRALSELFEWNFDDEKVNEWAYECEKISHGTPSGIDNTCATYGSLIWFEKNMGGGKNTTDPFSLGKPLLIVLGDTGKKGNTGELVAGVRERKEANEEEYAPIFERAKNLTEEAKVALEVGDQNKIGELMDENQELLRKIGVSCDELEELIKIAKEKGALGAKITGAGGGGLMYALAENEEKQEEIAKAFEEKGYKAIKTQIG